MYEENEVHKCSTCGLQLRVTFAAVPVEPLMCCNILMELVGIEPDDAKLDLTERAPLENAGDRVYQKGEKYTCSICGVEVVILAGAQPVYMLDCCGEGMELLES